MTATWTCLVAVVAAVAASACDRQPTLPSQPPTIPQNTTPVVSLAFEGPSSCAPAPTVPCKLTLIATASDADGDPLNYYWDGCAYGSSNGPRGECTVRRPTTYSASVKVTDADGHAVVAFVEVKGVLDPNAPNQPPQLQLSSTIAFQSPGSFELYGNIVDPEEGTLPCSGSLNNGPSCGYASATATGDCRSEVWVRCTCLAGLEVIAFKTAAAGSCELKFDLKDSWGMKANATLTVRYPR